MTCRGWCTAIPANRVAPARSPWLAAVGRGSVIGTPIGVPGLGVTVKGPDVMGTSVNPIVFAVPFAFGLQATPELQLQASTILANFSIKDSATTYISDITPLTIDAIFALGHNMDVRVDLSLLDLQHAGDFLAVAAGINLRM